MKELLAILREFGFEPKSRDEQADLMQKLDGSRALAREAGIKEVGEDGSPNLTFWSFVQLMRVLRTEHEREAENNMERLMNDLSFSQQEVDQFRQIFRKWTGQDR